MEVKTLKQSTAPSSIRDLPSPNPNRELRKRVPAIRACAPGVSAAFPRSEFRLPRSRVVHTVVPGRAHINRCHSTPVVPDRAKSCRGYIRRCWSPASSTSLLSFSRMNAIKPNQRGVYSSTLRRSPFDVQRSTFPLSAFRVPRSAFPVRKSCLDLNPKPIVMS